MSLEGPKYAFRRSLTPWLFLGLLGASAGMLYRYLADDPSEATVSTYLRSAVHGVGLALSGWAMHLYFTSYRTEWLRRWPLTIEVVVRSLGRAVTVGIVALGLQALLYNAPPEASWPVSG